MAVNPHILVVDDDSHIRDVLRYALHKANFRVTEAEDGAAALRVAAHTPFDLIVLDILMPEKDGIEVCTDIRRTSQVPILFLSSKNEEIDRIVGLEIGADDYVSKPFSPRELVARIKAILRRPRTDAASPSTTVGALAINGDRREVTWLSLIHI